MIGELGIGLGDDSLISIKEFRYSNIAGEIPHFAANSP